MRLRSREQRPGDTWRDPLENAAGRSAECARRIAAQGRRGSDRGRYREDEGVDLSPPPQIGGARKRPLEKGSAPRDLRGPFAFASRSRRSRRTRSPASSTASRRGAAPHLVRRRTRMTKTMTRSPLAGASSRAQAVTTRRGRRHCSAKSGVFAPGGAARATWRGFRAEDGSSTRGRRSTSTRVMMWTPGTSTRWSRRTTSSSTQQRGRRRRSWGRRRRLRSGVRLSLGRKSSKSSRAVM